MNEPALRSHVLYSRSAAAAADGAFAVLNGVQLLDHPADQVIGMACALLFCAEACGYAPTALLALAEQMEADCRHRDVNTLSAVREYAKQELGKKLR